MAAQSIINIGVDGKEWRPVPGFEGVYLVSEAGEVKRIIAGAGRAKVGAMLKTAKNRKGYHYLNLCKAGRQQTKYLHVLVCEVFHGERPSLDHQAAHRDDDKDRNSKDNVYWATPLQNHADRRRNGRILTGSRIGRSKLKEQDIPKIIEMRRSGMTCVAIAEKYGVAPHTISRITTGVRWQHMGLA